MTPRPLPEWVTSKELGVFSSVEEKYEKYFMFRDIEKQADRFAIAYETKRVALLARQAGADRFIPDWLKQAMQHICSVAPYAEYMPEKTRLDFIRTAGKITQAVCMALNISD